jgi:hypothetical protein
MFPLLFARNLILLKVAQAAEVSRRAEATEKKVAVLTAGFMKRAASLSTQVSADYRIVRLRVASHSSPLLQVDGLADAAYDKRVLLETYTRVIHLFVFIHSNIYSFSFTQLREAEQQVLPIRMIELQERLAALQARESECQARYSELSRAMTVQ